MDTRSDQQPKVERIVRADVRAPAESNVGSAWDVGPHVLFLTGMAMRGVLALIIVGCAVYVLSLLDSWGGPAWLVLGLTSAGLAWVLLDDVFDIEGMLAREVALAARFDPDQFGARAAAVRAYSDEFVHRYGHAPHGPTSLKQPGTDRSFRADFVPASISQSGYAKVLLMCLQRALAVVAVGFLAVTAAQLCIVLAS